jgi:hypothetical protein
MSEIEKWLPINGYNGAYQISTNGIVRTVKEWRFNGRGNARFFNLKEPLIKRQIKSNHGYLKVTLYKRSKGTWYQVHQLVLATFVGKKPTGFVGAHLNGVKTDNRLANLKWVTPKENSSHRKLHGTTCDGEKNGRARLTANQVIEIRKRFSIGEPVCKIHKDFQFVRYCAVKRAAHKISWKTLTRA